MTIYANVVNVRGAGREVVLEFGSFLPGYLYGHSGISRASSRHSRRGYGKAV
jgi:hypothetical protein